MDLYAKQNLKNGDNIPCTSNIGGSYYCEVYYGQNYEGEYAKIAIRDFNQVSAGTSLTFSFEVYNPAQVLWTSGVISAYTEMWSAATHYKRKFLAFRTTPYLGYTGAAAITTTTVDLPATSASLV